MANRISSCFSSPVSLGDLSNSDGNTGRQIEMRCSVKRKRGNSGRSESRERKMIRSDHRSASEYSVDSLSSGFSSLALLGDTSSSDLSSGSQVEMRWGVKRRNEKSGRSESVERKRRRLDLQSDSLIDSLTSAFSCLYIRTPPAACGETPVKVSSNDEELPGLSHLNDTEVTSGESPVKGSRNDEPPGLSHLNNSEVISGESPVKGSRNDEEQPGVSHLNNSEVISGESPVKGSRNDAEQPGVSHLNNSEVTSEESPVKGSRNYAEQPGVSHFNNSEVISGESPVKGSRNDEPPGVSHLNNSEVISGESPVKECIIDDEQPGQSRPIKLDQGVKKKRELWQDREQ